MLLFHCILTFMKDLFQSQNQVSNPTRLLVLLHCWVGKDWAGTFFPSSKMYLSIYFSFSLLNYAALSLLLNTNVWPVPKRESSFQTNKFIGTSTLSGGESLGRPNLPPPPPKCSYLSIYLFSLLDYATLWMYLNTFEWPIPKWELSFLTYKFIGTSTLWGGERLGRPILSPPPPNCFDLSINYFVFRFMLLFDCIWTILNDLFQSQNQVFKPTS